MSGGDLDIPAIFWWRKIPGAPTGIVSGTGGNLGRTTDHPYILAGQLSHRIDFDSGRTRTHSGEGRVVVTHGGPVHDRA
jgi:hypothetical protein